MRKMYDVFLSHRSVDKSWVSQLKKDLQRHQVRVWLDQDEMRPGDVLVKALEEGLARCRTVVLVVTPEALASPWVRAEYDCAVTMAITQGKRLIPVLLRDTAMPGFLASRAWVDFRDPRAYHAQVAQLVRGILETEPLPSHPPQVPAPATPRAAGMRTGGVKAGGTITARTIVDGLQVQGGDADTIRAVERLTQDMQSGGVEAGQDIQATTIVEGVQVVASDLADERG